MCKTLRFRFSNLNFSGNLFVYSDLPLAVARPAVGQIWLCAYFCKIRFSLRRCSGVGTVVVLQEERMNSIVGELEMQCIMQFIIELEE